VNQADFRTDQKADPAVGTRLGVRECVMATTSKNTSISKAVADLWQSVTVGFFGGYRPERHYMRGPGPKWRAKHAAPKIISEPDLGGMAKVSAL